MYVCMYVCISGGAPLVSRRRALDARRLESRFRGGGGRGHFGALRFSASRRYIRVCIYNMIVIHIHVYIMLYYLHTLPVA